MLLEKKPACGEAGEIRARRAAATVNKMNAAASILQSASVQPSSSSSSSAALPRVRTTH